MAEKSVFEQIKKQNGERFAKAIRGYDNGIFDIPGIVDIVKYAGHEAEPIMEYLESLKEIKIEETGVYQDPLTLLDAAGYDAYYVTNLEEQNRIQKYYADGEKLCTFHDPHRFENYHIINAVRKDVDQIRREDFRGREKREDEYGTSVLSIQILKSGGFISIKNRYNHTVDNPDNTFFSNPDLIIPGLSNSLRHHFNTDFSSSKSALPDSNYTLINGQIVRFNYELDNTYFGPNFYAKDGQIHHLKDHEIMLGSHIFDMRTKTLSYPGALYTFIKTEEDTEFEKAFLKEIEGHKVILKKDKDGQHLFIRREGEKDPSKDIEILTVKDGVITALNLPTTTKIGNHFLELTGASIKTFTTPRLEYMGSGCFYFPNSLTTLQLPNLKHLGDKCFGYLYSLKSLDLPALTEIGNRCFVSIGSLETLNLPSLTDMGDCCLRRSNNLKSLYLPALTHMGDGCFDYPSVKTANLPALTTMGKGCFWRKKNLETAILPLLTQMGPECFDYTTSLKSFYAPLLSERPKRFASHMNPIKRMILWMKRKQPPKDLPVAETGISAALRATESTKTGDPKGIS
ncbi:MAG: leucine-rich repeat domain-containing protein, partial [Alphaproteobacteria bacterium]|nr:leucine-rich repeat domain-containing protein [Alphaproteobacteria bacterium]